MPDPSSRAFLVSQNKGGCHKSESSLLRLPYSISVPQHKGICNVINASDILGGNL